MTTIQSNSSEMSNEQLMQRAKDIKKMVESLTPEEINKLPLDPSLRSILLKMKQKLNISEKQKWEKELQLINEMEKMGMDPTSESDRVKYLSEHQKVA